MTETWWAEWQYEPDERDSLTDSRQRTVGRCRIGPAGIYWPGERPLFTEFGELTAVEIRPGAPPGLHFKWRQRKPKHVIPTMAPLELILLNLALAVGLRLLPETEWEATLPIPRRHEAESAALVDRFRTLIKPKAAVQPPLSASPGERRIPASCSSIILLLVVLTVLVLAIFTVVSILAFRR